MRNKLILIAAMAMFAAGANAQNTDETKKVLRLCREKCQSIKGGHYEAEYRMKYMDDKDTLTSHLICDYKKLPNDTVFGKLFAATKELKNTKGYYLYTGNEFIYSFAKEAVSMPCDHWTNEIIRIRHNFDFYDALTESDASPLPSEEELADSNLSYSLTETTIDGKPCYKADYVRTMLEPNMFGIQTLRLYNQIWIDRENYLPLQITSVIDIKEGEDTLCQYEQYKLLAFDTTINESRFSLESIPEGTSVKEYSPEKNIKTLGKGKRAPEWSLPTLAGDTISLSDFRGKVVLVDFFYKSCAPCCAALPTLQRMHEKYKDQGVVIIGIDPYDDPIKNEMADFIKKRSVGYTVVFSSRNLPQKYHVTGYPTLFFINAKGKIEKVHEGFSQTMEQELEEQIRKMLKK